MKLREIILLLGLILIGIIYWDLRHSGILSFSTTNVSSDTVIVNLPPQTINFPPGQPVTIINQPMPSNVDTGAVLRAFFSEVTYLDSVDTDTLKIVLKEVISQNKIVSRELTHRLKIPITTITNVYHRPSMYLVGGSVSKTDQVSLQANVGYLTKRDVLIYGSFDPSTRQWGVGAMVPIRRSKGAFSPPANK
jgi:hypothetical protein